MIKNIILSIFYIFIFTLISSAQSGQIKGKIYDITNNEPLSFASIIIDGTNVGTTSDMDGNFIFTGLKPGFLKMTATYVGYKSKTSQDIILSNNNNPYIEIAMEPLKNVLNEVMVTTDPFDKNIEAPLSMQSIGVKEIECNPGSNRDISRVIQSFPGVGSTPNYRNDLIIRGGGPSENRFYLDDVEIPILNHFSTQGASGGPTGIINSDFIKSVDFYSGSFPADKYNALSGILDFKQKEGSIDRNNIQLALGASEASMTLDGHLNSNSNYIFSVRRSYLQYLFSAIGLPFLPTFNDYQLKFKTNINSKNQLTIISLGSLDNVVLNTDIKNPDKTQQYILSQIPINDQWSYTFGAVYKNFFHNGYHTLVMSRNMLNNKFYKYPDNDESKPKIFDYYSTEAENKIRYEMNLQTSKIKYVFSAGTEFAKYYNDTKQAVFANSGTTIFAYKTAFDMIKYSFSGQASTRILSNKLLFTGGIRTDANNYGEFMKNPLNQLSPRFSASYTLTSKSALNAGIGRYYQLPAYTTLGFRDETGTLINSKIKYIGADHFTLGIDYRYNPKIILSIEGFIKKYFNYPIDLLTGISLANQGADYSIAGVSKVTSIGKGTSKGVEFLARFNFKTLSSIVTYTFFNSKFGGLNSIEIPSAWDSKHLLTITANKELKKNWRVGMKWRFVGGLPYTPFDIETSSLKTAWDAQGKPYFDYAKLNSLRLKPYHNLDIRIDKNYFFKNWALMLYMDIQNVYNFQYKSQDYIVRSKDDGGNYILTDNGKKYVLENVENINGNVLPTIGIMIKL